MQKQEFHFECPNCQTTLDLKKLESEGKIRILNIGFEHGSPSSFQAGVLCPGCGKLVNPKTVFSRDSEGEIRDSEDT